MHWDTIKSLNEFGSKVCGPKMVMGNTEPEAFIAIRSDTLPHNESHRTKHKLVCHSFIFDGVGGVELTSVFLEVNVALKLTEKGHPGNRKCLSQPILDGQSE